MREAVLLCYLESLDGSTNKLSDASDISESIVEVFKYIK